MCIICENKVVGSKVEINECNTIKKISGFGNVEMIICHFCDNLEEISNNKNLKRLICIHSRKLRNIENNPKIIAIKINYSKGLTFLPQFPKIEYLDITGCYNIKEIPYYSSLRYLNCYTCDNLEYIPYLPLLMFIDYGDTKVSKIHVSKLLKNLCNINTSSKVYGLRNIINRLTFVHTSDIKIINSLKYSKVLEQLDVIECDKLVKLKLQDNVKLVYFYGSKFISYVYNEFGCDFNYEYPLIYAPYKHRINDPKKTFIINKFCINNKKELQKKLHGILPKNINSIIITYI